VGARELKPFVTSSHLQPRKKDQLPSKAESVPAGFKNLYDYEEERRRAAGRLFQKMEESDVHNLRDMFLLWTGKNRKLSP
jgi:hypothetical protein